MRCTQASKERRSCSLVRCDHTDRVSVAGDDQPPPATPRDSELIFPPPPQPLPDLHGGQRFHVERILNLRDVKGQRTSYLVRWCGYPPSHDSWDPRSQLMIDVGGLVHQYDETHPMDQKGIGKHTPMLLVERLQISNRIVHLRRDVRPTPGRRKGVNLPVDPLCVVETTRTWVAPHEALNICLTSQIVQFGYCTS